MDKELHKLRHTASHILAQAVKELYPKAKLAIGPAIEEGFYYDFDIKPAFTDQDLKKLEKKMKEISKRDLKLVKEKISKQKAKNLLKKEPYKLELLKDLKEGQITFYTQGDFKDLCSGPHTKSTKEVKHFKLLRTAGAYWLGNSKNKMLSRIYGTAFKTEKELKEYLELLEEAKKRDHKKIGKELNLFMISDLVGKGLPIWLPKGEIVKNEIEKLAIEMENKAGFQRVSTPHIAKGELFKKSGHLPHYEDSMYPKMKMDDGTYYLKAMNCPLHHLIFNQGIKSYKDFPIKIAEYGTVYRNELSGTLSGLLRVRMLSMNDAHIYCRKDQIAQEVEQVIKMVNKYFKIFGFEDYHFRLSLWDPKNKEKYINEPKNWKYSENELRKILKKLKVKFVEEKDEAAFYGPKIDIQFKWGIGREETLSTIQLDFAAKERFDFKYFDKNNKLNKEVFVIHRAPLATHERFLALVIEKFMGKFPTWLSPTQVKVLTVNDSHIKYSKEIKELLESQNIRVELDHRSESIGKKVRDAISEKIPYIINIGDKEVKSKKLAIRKGGKVDFGVSPEKFLEEIKQEIENRT